MKEKIRVNVEIGKTVSEIVSALLLNAFYSAQVLHVSQGKALGEKEREEILGQ